MTLNIHTLYSKAQSPPPLCWCLTSLTFRASTVYKSLKEKQGEVERSEREEPIEEGYVCMEVAAKRGESRAAAPNGFSREMTFRCYILQCVSLCRENIMPTSGGKKDVWILIELIYWISSRLLVLDGIHDYLLTHLKANRIYGSESSAVQRLCRSTCKQSATAEKIHIHHLYMSIRRVYVNVIVL